MVKKNKLKIIGISGKFGTGKDVVGQIINNLSITNKGPIWEIKKFADKLKQVASIITNIEISNFEDQEFKKALLGPEWGLETKTNILNAVEPFKDITFNHLMSVRELLQKIGTDAMRKGIHPNVWINALFSEYVSQNWIITDVRFPNEFNKIKNTGGIVIRINRQGYGTSMVALANDHSSETALDGHDFDHVINNDGTMEELIKNVRKILVDEKLI